MRRAYAGRGATSRPATRRRCELGKSSRHVPARHWDMMVRDAGFPESLHSARTMGFLGYFNGFGGRDMAVDLGTANTLVYVRGRGIVLSGAVGRRDRPAHRRGPRRRRRGEAHARPHARDDPGDPPAEGRRHRRLRRHRADAPPLHPEGAPAPLRAPARRRLRPVRRHRRREARRRGGDALGRRAQKPT